MSDNQKTTPSLSSLSSTRQASTNTSSLSQLKQKLQKPTNDTSLASLASLSASKKPMSSLQSLAQRNKTTSTPSLASLAQKSSTNAGTLPSLSHLASRQTKPNSLTHLAAPPVKQPSPAINNATVNPSSLPSLTKKKPMAAPLTAEPEPRVQEEEPEMENPLCAPPSAAAQFLFEPQPKIMFDPKIIFQQAVNKSTHIQPFSFDKPSPDDVVLSAQSQRSGANKKT
ncbi:hypothetical protein EDC96DRAFT_102434 [Choanephora cucurbitarum]|nr:hypothetical protein EDC96DRAFT_102434 [Choanephora cucurbitarum]